MCDLACARAHMRGGEAVCRASTLQLAQKYFGAARLIRRRVRVVTPGGADCEGSKEESVCAGVVEARVVAAQAGRAPLCLQGAGRGMVTDAKAAPACTVASRMRCGSVCARARCVRTETDFAFMYSGAYCTCRCAHVIPLT